jgi:CDP-paratose synthetase
MSVLWLTGASGFLGRNLLKSSLLEQFEVVAVLRDGSRFTSPGVACVPISELHEKAPPPEIILHAATDYGRSPSCVGDVILANVTLPLKLVEMAGKHLRSFVAIDSYYNKPAEVYPHLEGYCLSKRALIDWLRLSKHDFHLSRVFLEHMYGPNDRADKFVPNVLAKLLKNEDILLTSGLQTRDFIHVSDASRAILQICQKSMSETVNASTEYEVGTGISTSIRDFVIEAKSVSHSSSKLEFGAIPERIGEIESSVADLSTFKSIGFRPDFDLKNGLSATWSFYAEN